MPEANEELVTLVVDLLEQHAVAWVESGEVRCEGCPERGWISREEYHEHLAEHLGGAGVLGDAGPADPDLDGAAPEWLADHIRDSAKTHVSHDVAAKIAEEAARGYASRFRAQYVRA